MAKVDDNWFKRLKQFLQFEPKNKDELINLLRDAQDRSLIDAETLAMIEGTLIFTQMKVRDIMFPKHQMVSVVDSQNLAQIIEIVRNSGHSRFPVYSDENEEFTGILHAKDLLRYYDVSEDDFAINDIIREATFVPESKSLNALLSEFRRNRNHMALVVDEYGSVSGFVTIEDIIEQIIGEIEDEFDIEEEPYIISHSNHRFTIKAYTPIEEFNKFMHADFSEENYDTIGGILMANFGHLPRRGEQIQINNFSFKILNADARSIKLVECIDKREQ